MIERDAHEGHALGLPTGIEVLDGRYLGTAVAAPTSPEVNDYPLASIVDKGMKDACAVGQFEGIGGCAYLDLGHILAHIGQRGSGTAVGRGFGGCLLRLMAA